MSWMRRDVDKAAVLRYDLHLTALSMVLLGLVQLFTEHGALLQPQRLSVAVPAALGIVAAVVTARRIFGVGRCLRHTPTGFAAAFACEVISLLLSRGRLSGVWSGWWQGIGFYLYDYFGEDDPEKRSARAAASSALRRLLDRVRNEAPTTLPRPS